MKKLLLILLFFIFFYSCAPRIEYTLYRKPMDCPKCESIPVKVKLTKKQMDRILERADTVYRVKTKE
jgi:hypothetical protein